MDLLFVFLLAYENPFLDQLQAMIYMESNGPCVSHIDEEAVPVLVELAARAVARFKVHYKQEDLPQMLIGW